MDNNTIDFEKALDNLRFVFNSNADVRDESKRYNTTLLIAKNRDPNSVLVEHKKILGDIVSKNLQVQNELIKQNLTYEKIIDNLKISIDDKRILQSFIVDLNYLLPIGGNLPDPEPSTKPSSDILKAWSNILVIFTCITSFGPAIQPFVDLKIHNEEREQRKIENEFREKEIELDIKKTQQKELELNLEEGKINIPEKNIDIFY